MVFTQGAVTDFHSGTAIVTFSDVDLSPTVKTLDLEGFGPDVQGSYLELLTMRIEMATTATGGNRMLSVRLEATASPVILYEIAIGNNSLPANQSRTWQLAPEAEEVSMPMATNQVKIPPRLCVNANQRLVIEDSAAIDAADSLVVHVMSRVYDIRSL